MQSLLVQDWITLSAPSGKVIFQAEADWVDVGPFQDLVIFTEFKEFSGTNVAIAYYSSPAPEEVMFSTIGGGIITAGVTVTPILKDVASVPIAKWFRYGIGGASTAWDATFRIWVAANAVGANGRKRAMDMDPSSATRAQPVTNDWTGGRRLPIGLGDSPPFPVVTGK